MGDNLKLLLRLLYQPASAMGAILDRGSLLFASAAVLAASLWLKIDAPWLPFSFYAPLLVLAAVYVPGALLLRHTGDLGALPAIATGRATPRARTPSPFQGGSARGARTRGR